MYPAGGQQVAQPYVAVLGDQAVGPACEGGGVQLEEGGQVVAVRHRDEVIDGLGRV